MTGLALGDHLHFGVIVQGVEVRPEEWMDSKWLHDNVFSIIDSGKKIINQGS
jgi:murein DD-endopeptidase MepM/ murein hydrolase activator NlpD